MKKLKKMVRRSRRKLAVFMMMNFFMTAVAWADGNVGLSYLALCKDDWPCQKSLEVFDGLPQIRTGWLGTTFGERCACAEKILSDPREKFVRIHILNGPGLRNKRLGKYESPLYGETIQSANKKIKAKDQRFLEGYRARAQDAARTLRAADRRALRCAVSPCLECDFDADARKTLLEETRKIFPTCELVDNPLTDRCLPGYICEKHAAGGYPRLQDPCITDLDGMDFGKADVPKFVQNSRECAAAYLWGFGMNCVDKDNPNFVDPRKRVCGMKDAVWKDLKRYMQPGATSPAPVSPVNRKDTKGCKKVVKANDGVGGFLLKQSDSYPGMVALMPRRVGFLRLVKDGRTLAEFRYQKPYTDGRLVYRTNVTQAQVKKHTNAVMRTDIDCRVIEQPGFRVD